MKKHSPKAKGRPFRQMPEVREKFTGRQPQTKYGGAGLWRRFLKSLGVPKLLQQVRVPWDGRLYEAGDYLLAMLAGLLLGKQRQCAVADLRQDPGALLALGLEDVPSQSALSRFLDACTFMVAGRLLRLNRQLVRRMRQGQRSATIDLDGQVVVTRGNPEGADFGYCPKRRGAKSYYVLMGFLGGVRDILDAMLLPGSASTVSAQMAIRVYRRCRNALGSQVKRVRLRADAAFFSNAFLSQLEHDGVTYCVPLRLNGGLKAKLPGVSYQQLNGRWAVAEFLYEGADAPPRRCVVIRERLEPQGQRASQLNLFQYDGYAFQAIVTNATWVPQSVWHFYNDRSCLENIIKESQYDFGSNHVLCHSLAGNRTWLALTVLAYNITNWFREKILNQQAHRQTAATLRQRLIEIPATLIYSARQYTLKIWREHPSRKSFERAMTAVQAWSPQ